MQKGQRGSQTEAALVCGHILDATLYIDESVTSELGEVIL